MKTQPVQTILCARVSSRLSVALNEIVCGLKGTNHTKLLPPLMKIIQPLCVPSAVVVLNNDMQCFGHRSVLFIDELSLQLWHASTQRVFLGFWQFKRSANIYFSPLLSQELVSRCDVAELRSAV